MLCYLLNTRLNYTILTLFLLYKVSLTPFYFPSHIPPSFPSSSSPLSSSLPPSFPSYHSSLEKNDVHVSGRQLENGLLALIEYLTQVRHKLNSNKTLR